MSGTVIPFPRRQRAWRVTETQPGLYYIELQQRDRGVICSTESAKFTRTHRFLRRARNGWRVWLCGLDEREVLL